MGYYQPTDLKKGAVVQIDGKPFRVIDYNQKVMGRGGSIVNVKIKNLIVVVTGNSVGALAGKNFGLIEQVAIEGGEVSGDDRVGGIVGVNDGQILNSYTQNRVNGNSKHAGFVGRNQA